MTQLKLERKKQYKVYYQKHLTGFLEKLTIHKLAITHTYVKDVMAVSLSDVFYQMQGEVWSPNGEQRDFILNLHLLHTSMMEGDVILDISNLKYYRVDSVGFSEIN